MCNINLRRLASQYKWIEDSPVNICLIIVCRAAYGQNYDMNASYAYSQPASGSALGGAYAQSPSGYGPSKSAYGGERDRTSNHPYARR